MPKTNKKRLDRVDMWIQPKREGPNAISYSIYVGSVNHFISNINKSTWQIAKQGCLYSIYYTPWRGSPGSNRLPSERHVSLALEREARRGPWICRSHLPNRPNKTYGPYTTRGPYTTCSDATVSPFVSWREEADTGHGFGSYATIKVYVTINASTILAPYFQVGAA